MRTLPGHLEGESKRLHVFNDALSLLEQSISVSLTRQQSFRQFCVLLKVKFPVRPWVCLPPRPTLFTLDSDSAHSLGAGWAGGRAGAGSLAGRLRSKDTGQRRGAPRKRLVCTRAPLMQGGPPIDTAGIPGSTRSLRSGRMGMG